MLVLCLLPGAALAGPLRIATWHADLSRDGPGLLLRDIASGTDPSVEAALSALLDLSADLVLLTRFDTDLEGRALSAFADRLAAAGLEYPHRFSPPQNRGRATGLDLDGDGRTGGRDDAQGYGRFAGAGSMALLSRHPLGEARDFSGFLWADLPGARLDGVPEGMRGLQRLSSSAHWDVPVLVPGGRRLHLLAWAATPPVFGTGSRNRDRNHDEAAFWLHLLDGRLPFSPPDAAFVLLGLANLDPTVGSGDGAIMAALSAHPALSPPPHGPTYALKEGPARLSVILPGAGLDLAEARTRRVEPHRHALVWVDLAGP